MYVLVVTYYADDARGLPTVRVFVLAGTSGTSYVKFPGAARLGNQEVMNSPSLPSPKGPEGYVQAPDHDMIQEPARM